MTRKCHKCGKDWNVSRLDPGGKCYICPVCAKAKDKRPISKERRSVR